MKRNHLILPIIFLFIVGGIAALLFGFYLPTAHSAPSAASVVQAAWQKASQVGAYTYTTDVVQTSTPELTLHNVGLTPFQEQFYLEGEVNKPEDSMHMKLWSGSGNAVMGQGAIEIKVENGRSYGRVNDGEWEAVDQLTDFFAPGQDPLGYLNAAADMAHAGWQIVTPPGSSAPQQIDKYTYQLDGPQFARYMRNQLEDQLRREGKLPGGLQLETASVYADMTGDGELWLNEQGLPVRQIIRITFPPQDGEQVSATITTDFAQWPHTAVAATSPIQIWLQLTAANWQTIAINTGLTLLVIAFVLALISTRYGRKLQHALALTIIVSMLFAPLLETQQLFAFYDEVETMSGSTEQDTAVSSPPQPEAAFDPQQDPLFAPVSPTASNQYAVLMQAAEDNNEELPITDEGLDTDGDEVTDYLEIFLETDLNNPDSDGDGLNDGVELFKLGTYPLADGGFDSDGDGLSDGAEVRGFVFNSQRWYLNPLDADTNKDGVVDGYACDVDSNDNLICPDTDGDALPDVFDFDDDNDGVPDKLDSSPKTMVGNISTGLPDQTFNLTLDQFTPDEPLFVDFQLRPTNPDHLWYTLNVLDWPGNDSQGQVTRMFDTTYGSSGREANGDMRLIPMLEIAIPYQDGHYGNLPVRDGAPPITASSAITEWLDMEMVQSFGMSVRRQNDAGDLLAYVPLTLLREEQDGRPVAFTGRMAYRPESADFGSAHSVRLLWLVEALTDSCLPMPSDYMQSSDLSESERNKSWCADSSNWQANGSTIIHGYYDDYYITGMDIREDLGLETAVIFQDPTFTASQPGYTPTGFHDDNLWILARGLDRSYLMGRDDGTGSRDMTIDTVTQRFDKRQNGSTTATDRWEIPQDALFVERFDFEHQGYLATLPMTHTKEILATYFTPQAVGGITDPTLMFLREERFRSVNLGLASSVGATAVNGVISSNTINFSLDPQNVKEMVVASMNWAPYQYEAATSSWQAYAPDDYWFNKGEDLEAILQVTSAYPEFLDVELFLAQAYYFNVRAGVNALVEMDDLAAGLTDQLNDFDLANYLYDTSGVGVFGTGVQGVIGSFTSVFDKMGKMAAFQNLYSGGRLSLGDLNDLGVNTFAVYGHLKRAGMLGISGSGHYSNVKLGNVSSSAKGMEKIMGIGHAVGKGNAIISTLATIVQLATVFAGYGDGIALNIVFASISLATNLVSLTSAMSTFIVMNQALGLLKTVGIVDTVKAFVQSMNLKSFVIGAVIAVAITVGLFVYQMMQADIKPGTIAFDMAVVEAVTTVIAVVIIFAIGAIPVIGQIIAAIVGIIDAIIAIICTAVQAAPGTLICGGITGLLAKALQYIGYDVRTVIDMENSNRLNLSNFNTQLSTPADGFAVGNSMVVAVDVGTALYPNDHKNPLDSFSDSTIKENAFTYQFLDLKSRIDDGLEMDDMVHLWQPPASDSWAADSAFVHERHLTGSIPFSQAGINHHPNFYLAEGFVIASVSCAYSGLPSTKSLYVCNRTPITDTLHLDLGSLLTFDIFPQTVTDFYALRQTGSGGYALEWGTFPTLLDADGDGLRSRALGGNDPNDSLPDTDGDGLSDFIEVQLGFDPAQADGDNDGLNDYEERRHNTDPYLADTDRDGLTDAEEVAGWEIVYGFNGTTPLRTHVWSNPLDANADEDAYTDFVEKAYGFHPEVPSDGAPLTMVSAVDEGDTVVRPGETIQYTSWITNNLSNRHLFGLLDAQFPAVVQNETLDPQPFILEPSDTAVMNGNLTIDNIAASQVLSLTNRAGAIVTDLKAETNGRTFWYHLNETSGSQFDDSSFYGHDATCSTCPTLGVPGYQETAVQFDGSDSLTIDATPQDLGFVSNSFTVMGWVNTGSLASQQAVLSVTPPPPSGSGPIIVANPIVLGINNGRVSLSGFTTATSTDTLSADTWHHVAWRYNHKTKEYAVFIDGEKQGSATITFAFGSVANGTARIGQGVSGITTWQNFTGLLDELEMVPVALSDSEIGASTSGQSDLVFYYEFEKAPIWEAGTTWTDDSLYGNEIACGDNGNGPQCPGDNYRGFINDGYRFGGSQSSDVTVMQVITNTNLNLSRGNGSFTLSAWINKQQDEGGRIMGNEGANSGYPRLRVDGGSIQASFGVSPNQCSLEADQWQVLQDTKADTYWHHVAVTFDGNDFIAYLNGIEVQRENCAGMKPADVETFYIGNTTVSDSNKYRGFLDELRIYDKSLAANEISDLYWDMMPTLELRLDEAPAREIFADISLSNMDGSCSGTSCPVSGIPGRINQALLYDGVNDTVNLNTTEALKLTDNAFSVSAWVNGRSLNSQTRPILGTTSASSGDSSLLLGLENGYPVFQLGDTTITAPDALQPDRWYHIAWTYDYDRPPDEFTTPDTHIQSILVDGTVVVSTTLSTPAPLPAGSPESLSLGQFGSSDNFSGRIDQFMIHRQALSPERVQDLMAQAPLINLHFDEAEDATTFVNDANSALNATCSGASCPASGVKGQIYNGLSFDGQTDLVEIPNSNALQMDEVSVGLWVKPAFQRSQPQMLVTTSGGGLIFRLEIDPDSMNVRAQTRDVSCTYDAGRELLSEAALIPNVWNHVMLTYDGAVETLYINGALDATVAAGNGLCQSNTLVSIGNRGSNPFAGELDELVVYPSALSRRDVAEQFVYQASWYDTSYSHSILVDADTPEVNLDIAAPYLPLREHIMAVQAHDGTSNIELVEYQIDNGGWQPAARDLNVWLFNFQPAAEGAYIIDVRATDTAGHVTTDGGNSITVDNTPPVIENVNVDGVTAVSTVRNHPNDSWDVQLSGDIVDVYSPIASLFVTLLDENGSPVNGRLPATINGSTFAINYPFNLRPNGVYTVTLESSDEVGNQNNQQVIANLDSTPPTADQTLSNPDNILLLSGTTITGTVVETGAIQGNVSQVEISIAPLEEQNLSSAHTMKDGLRLLLPLDESELDVNDQPTSLFANLMDETQSATCTGTTCPVAGEEGVFAQAAHFDGQNDRLTVASLPTDLDDGALSFGLWVRLETAVSNEQNLLQFSNGQSLLYNQNQQRFIYRDSEAGDQPSGNTFAPDQWLHILVSIDADGSGTLFVNGYPEATFNSDVRPQAGGQLRIGQQVQGWLDDLFVYTRPFTDQTARQHVRGFDPALHLPLEEDIFNDQEPVRELSRHPHQAIFNGSTTYPDAGIVGASALAFNGSDHAITVSGGEALDLSEGEFTQMAWVYRATGNEGFSIINGTPAAGQEAQAYPSLGVLNNQIGVSFGDGTTFDSYLTGDVLVENSWNFVAVSFDGDLYSIYVNGQLADSTTLFAGKRPYPTTSFAIGRNPLAGGSYLFNQGLLDDVRIYRQTLPDKAIADLYHQGWTPAALSSSSPSAIWSHQIPVGLEGAYKIRLRTTDSNGNVSIGSQGNEDWDGYITALGLNHVTIADVLEGETAVLSGNILNIAASNIVTMHVAWGDGAEDIYPYNGSASTFSFDHLYVDDDPTGTAVDSYPITLTLHYGDGRTGILPTTITVQNQAPVIDLPPSKSGVIEMPTPFTATFTDAGVRDTHTILWDFGDGATASGVLTPTHHYTATGTYTATLTITDDDGGTATETMSVKIGVGRVFLPIIMNNYASGPDLVVQNINVTANTVSVTIANVGDAPVEDAFWVDVYLNPNPPPTAVNQTWEMLGTQGLVWGVDDPALPLLPGQTMILTLGDAYFRPAESQFSGTIAAGTAVYAQVDSANSNHSLGAVRENHEINGSTYNNILGPVVMTSTLDAVMASTASLSTAAMPKRP